MILDLKKVIKIDKADSLYPLWSDEPATQDLLAFRSIAETVVDAIFHSHLNPVAIGLSGTWGSGKTTVLELITQELSKRNTENKGKQVLLVPTQPWRYDPSVGPKESLISDVLGAINAELENRHPESKAWSDAYKKLVKRVNWSKALKLVARTAITAQLPDLASVMSLVSDDPDKIDAEKGMDEFRRDFSKFLELPDLSHLDRVVVLVDDLDRCLPETVIETLEAIRLFLSVEGMSFVIAADEDRVAEAIRQKLDTNSGTRQDEPLAKLYLHKIVQMTVQLPSLSRYDTQAFLFLLLSMTNLTGGAYDELVEKCDELRRSGESLDSLEIDSAGELSEFLAMASRLTPILYEKFRGNPRRVKRFLNDLNIRRSIANRRGNNLGVNALAKLMVLERLLPSDFKTVLDWLASNQLRDRLDSLSSIALGSNRNASTAESKQGQEKSEESEKESSEELGGDEILKEDTKVFSDSLVRWAKLPPHLDASEISGYLYLAASFANVEIIDQSLPSHLLDLAATLSSSSKLTQLRVSDAQLRSLSESDSVKLVQHLGKRTRDQPSIQSYTIESLIRLYESNPDISEQVVSALKGIPPGELQFPTLILFRKLDKQVFGPVIEVWKAGKLSNDIKRAIFQLENDWEGSNGH